MKKNKSFENFFSLIRPYKKSVLFLVVFIFLLESFRLLGPYILKLIIDNLIDFSPEKINYFAFLVFSFFLALAVVSVVDRFKDKGIFSIILKAEYDLPVKCQKKLLELDLNYHQNEGTGNKISKIERGIAKFISLLGTIFWELLPVAFQFISTSIILLIIDFRFFFVLLIFAVLLVFINIKANKDVYPIRKKRYRKHEEASGKMTQSIINVNTVQSFSQQKREVEDYKTLKCEIFNDERKEWFYILKFANLREIVVAAGRVSFLFLGIFLTIKGQISVGSLVFVITLSEKVFSSLSRAYRLYDRFSEGAEGVDRLSALLETESAIKNDGKIKLKKVEGDIVFKDVDFYYNKLEKVLDNLNLHIPAKKITALVGPSGGGKTTIVRLIFRHIDVSSGKLSLDTYNLKDLELANLRSFLSIVPQEVDVFNCSVAENIAYAKKGASLEKIRAAAKIANANIFIEKLSDKYSTIVGERGIKLSGGQRQRIGIARAVLADPKILIFDEATSNLDSESEKLIQDAIFRIAKNKTVIIIAHRLSTIRMADKIVVIENGQVAEEGGHSQLLNKKDGLYQKLISLQSLGGISEKLNEY
jgi:ABC-type multidrug transport system fused ATPase/permease subunit